MDTIKVANFIFIKSKPAILIESDWIVLILVLSLLIIGVLIYLFKYSKKYSTDSTDLELSSSPKIKFTFKRNTENLYIANRIYIELVTRKAALEIDEKNDVIDDIYESWYELFQIIREEIKNVPGSFLRKHKPTEELIGLTTEILNVGLRPHLTLYQAKFRKWYKEQKDDPKNKNISPQDIQKDFDDFGKLIDDMKKVNRILIKYANELKRFIDKN